jgi:hypothetical protein
MKPTLLILALILLFVSACSSVPRTTAAIQSTGTLIATDYFPLTTGTYWVYEGTVMWTVGTEVREKTIRWKMEVVEVVPAVHNNGVTAYVLKGRPGDLAWYEEGKERSDYVIIQSGQSRFYYAEVGVLSRLKDESDNLYDLVDEDRLFLDTPLLPGKTFCETEYITLHNGGYCWIVSTEKQVELEDVKGLDATDALTEYTICKGTQPDDLCFGFILGLGISHYKYNHHGTISYVDVRLVEYHSGSIEAATNKSLEATAPIGAG